MKIREKWIFLLHRAATGTRKTRMLLTPIGILIFGVFTTLFVISAIALDRLLSLRGLFLESTNFLLATPFVLIGVVITAWSAFHFLKIKGTPVPFNPPSRLVKTGPYRYVRNPMLTGIFLFLFGVGFGINSFSLVLVFTPLYIAMNVWELKQIEEPELVKRLGNEYVDYQKQTPMFIPGWKRRTK